MTYHHHLGYRPSLRTTRVWRHFLSTVPTDIVIPRPGLSLQRAWSVDIIIPGSHHPSWETERPTPVPSASSVGHQKTSSPGLTLAVRSPVVSTSFHQSRQAAPALQWANIHRVWQTTSLFIARIRPHVISQTQLDPTRYRSAFSATVPRSPRPSVLNAYAFVRMNVFMLYVISFL